MYALLPQSWQSKLSRGSGFLPAFEPVQSAGNKYLIERKPQHFVCVEIEKLLRSDVQQRHERVPARFDWGSSGRRSQECNARFKRRGMLLFPGGVPEQRTYNMHSG